MIKIKFWDKKLNVMWEPIELSKLLKYLIFQNCPNADAYMAMKDHFDDMVPLRFMEINDITGKEIYEKDIVKCQQIQGYKWPVIGIVHFGNEENNMGNGLVVPDQRVFLDTRPFAEHNTTEYCFFHANPKVIGNIYENPELLK